MKQALQLAAALAMGSALSTMAMAAGNDVLTQQLDEHVYMMSYGNYTSLVVIGEDDVLISDTANPHRAALLQAEIATLTDKPVGKIVLSHEHFDHTGGTDVFENAQIIAHDNLTAFAGLDPMDLVPDHVDVTYEGSLSIDMGTTNVELHYMGAADGLAVSVVYLPGEKIVMTADMYVDEGRNPGVFMTATNLLGSRRILNTLATWDLNHAINAHSVQTDLAPMIATAGFLNDLYDAVLPVVQQTAQENPAGLVPAVLELSQTLQMPAYETWPNYQDLPEYVRKMAFAIIHGG
jgi:hypothetical protein